MGMEFPREFPTSIFPFPGKEFGHPNDPQSPPRPPLPDEVRSSDTTAPPIPLERYKSAAFTKKNKVCAAGLSGTSFRVVWLLFSLAPEVSSRSADASNAIVANRVSREARDLVVAQKGGFIPKATDAPDDPATRPIAMRECFVRITLIPSCQDLRTEVRKVQVKNGNGRVQLGVGVRNGCATAAADISAVLALEGNVCQKGDVKNAFQFSNRSTIYDYILVSPLLCDAMLPYGLSYMD